MPIEDAIKDVKIEANSATSNGNGFVSITTHVKVSKNYLTSTTNASFKSNLISLQR